MFSDALEAGALEVGEALGLWWVGCWSQIIINLVDTHWSLQATTQTWSLVLFPSNFCVLVRSSFLALIHHGTKNHLESCPLLSP